MANPSVDALSSAYYHTRRILFCPFEPKKYLKLTLVYLLSGGMQSRGGGNFNNLIPKSHNHSDVENGTASMAQNCFAHAESFIKARGSADPLQNFMAFVQNWKNRFDSIFHSNDTGLMAMWSLIILGLVVLVFAMIYVVSVFQFIFLESIVTNKVAITDYWRKHKGLGFSYMLWMLVIMAIMLGTCAVCFLPPILNASSMGRTSSDAVMGSFCVAMIGALAVIIVLSIVAALTLNLVVPVMFIKNISILPAWGEVLKLARNNVGEFLLYCVIKVGLAVAFFMIALLAVILVLAVTALFFALPAFLVGLLLKSVVTTASLALIVLGGVWIALGVIFFIFLASVVLLPAGVFLKSYNLCFLGLLNQEYRVLFAE